MRVSFTRRAATKAAFASGVLLLLAAAPRVHAQKAYDAGASDKEIKIGNFTSYTGWAGAYGQVARAEAAYFQMINDQGGVNGRKIDFVSLDNGSTPGKSLELTRKLVEDEGVLLIFSPLGAEPNLAVRGYLNERKIPQLFVEASSAAFNDPAHFPWTMGFYASYLAEGQAYAKYILRSKPDAKIGVLYSDDELGREYLAGVRQGLGDKAAGMIVKAIAYPVPDAAFDLRIGELQKSRADVFLNLSAGPLASQAIRTAYDLGWHPLQFIPNGSLSVAAFLDPAGLKKSAGIISNARSKGYALAEDRRDPDVRAFLDWMAKYQPKASLRDQDNLAGYERAEALVAVLKKCGDVLTRENVLKQAASLDTPIGMLRPGIRLKTSATDYQPIKQFFLIRFDGRAWVPLGTVIEE